MADFISTRLLILRKTPYSDTSLVVAGVSPEAGQLHFLVRGARRIGKRQFPLADLFRELAIQYRPGRGELYSWHSAELAEDFSAVARYPERFEAACRLARFALANLHAGIAQPRCHLALMVALRRLAADTGGAPATVAGPAESAPAAPQAIQTALVSMALVFLDEHGLLSGFPSALGGAGACAAWLAQAGGAAITRPLSPEEGQRVRHWLRYALLDADFKAVPF